MVDNLPSAEYRFDAVHEGYDIPNESRPSFLRERVQGNPLGMMDYPPHGDNGKCLTILVPDESRGVCTYSVSWYWLAT